MDLAEEVHAWVSANWQPDITVGYWWKLMADAGLAYPMWPVGLGGREYPADLARTVSKVLAANGVIGPPAGNLAAGLAAPTILAHGSDEQRKRFVGAIARGRAAWCQLFSEPGSGSDLASVSTYAVVDGEEWIVNGQKVWNSSADQSDFGMLLARTDPSRPKHHGITFFAIDMHQPGVEVRPLRTMNGRAPFCEVFLTEARVEPGCVIGDINDGWRVAQTTLASERNFAAGGAMPGLIQAVSGMKGDLDILVGEVVARARRRASTESSPIKGYAVPWKVMLDLARGNRSSQDAVLRQDLMRYHNQIRINGWLMGRIAAAGGRLTGADGSVAKLATARVCQQSRDLAYRVVGASGMLTGQESPLAGALQTAILASPGTRLGGGTDEIQLNVLGERGLGLPREPTEDRHVPYQDLKVGTQKGAGDPLDQAASAPM